MTEHCMIDGKRCSECCKVLILQDNPPWRKYARENKGIVHDDPSHKQSQKVWEMVRPISRRRAKKINPFLVSRVGKGERKTSYFTCSNYVNGSCQSYEDRPLMCSGYPRYNYTGGEFKELTPDYREDCTYFIELT